MSMWIRFAVRKLCKYLKWFSLGKCKTRVQIDSHMLPHTINGKQLLYHCTYISLCGSVCLYALANVYCTMYTQRPPNSRWIFIVKVTPKNFSFYPNYDRKFTIVGFRFIWFNLAHAYTHIIEISVTFLPIFHFLFSLFFLLLLLRLRLRRHRPLFPLVFFSPVFCSVLFGRAMLHVIYTVHRLFYSFSSAVFFNIYFYW